MLRIYIKYKLGDQNRKKINKSIPSNTMHNTTQFDTICLVYLDFQVIKIILYTYYG